MMARDGPVAASRAACAWCTAARTRRRRRAPPRRRRRPAHNEAIRHQAVAGTVAVALVDGLEMVDVEVADGQQRALALAGGERSCSSSASCGAVGQAGDLVVMGPARHALLQLPVQAVGGLLRALASRSPCTSRSVATRRSGSPAGSRSAASALSSNQRQLPSLRRMRHSARAASDCASRSEASATCTEARSSSCRRDQKPCAGSCEGSAGSVEQGVPARRELDLAGVQIPSRPRPAARRPARLPALLGRAESSPVSAVTSRASPRAWPDSPASIARLDRRRGLGERALRGDRCAHRDGRGQQHRDRGREHARAQGQPAEQQIGSRNSSGETPPASPRNASRGQQRARGETRRCAGTATADAPAMCREIVSSGTPTTMTPIRSPSHQ